MTQDERWQRQYEEMMTFMENNHRRPSKHRLEEHTVGKINMSINKKVTDGRFFCESCGRFW